jgi:hypothetical protein
VDAQKNINHVIEAHYIWNKIYTYNYVYCLDKFDNRRSGTIKIRLEACFFKNILKCQKAPEKKSLLQKVKIQGKSWMRKSNANHGKNLDEEAKIGWKRDFIRMKVCF